jgi:hypothetical protein
MEITDKQRPPDLQELVARFGGYNKITAEGWAEYDRAMAEYQQQRREVIAGELEEYRKAKKEGLATATQQTAQNYKYIANTKGEKR